jgi:hypothetical protein
MFVMMKSIVIFAILLLGAAAFGNYCSLLSAASPSPTPEPTHVATLTPPEPSVSFTLWHTNSSVIQPPANELEHINPICEIVSPENQTILQTNNFTLSVNVASYFWVIDSVYYNADWVEGIHQIFGIQPSGGADSINASITVNFSEVPYGNHTLMVYANTHDGSHSFATLVFSNEMYSQKLTKPESFPTVTVAVVSIVTVVVVASGLLVYFKKHKR